MGDHYREQLQALLRERASRPKPFDLMRFFCQQSENLSCELSDGVSHYSLYLRYIQRRQIPEKITYHLFTAKLSCYRRLQGLPPRQHRRSESVTDPPAKPPPLPQTPAT